MSFVSITNRYGEAINATRAEIRNDPNRHDYGTVRTEGANLSETNGWLEDDPVRIRWGQDESGARNGIASREMVGYIAGHHLNHENTEAAASFNEIHVLGATSVLKRLPAQEEQWTNRSALDVIQLVLARSDLMLRSVGVDDVKRRLITKPEEQTYWDFLVSLAKSVGASLHPLNTTVLLLGHAATLIIPEIVEETASGGFGGFHFALRSSTKYGVQKKRWQVQYNDSGTGAKKTLDEHHLDGLATVEDRTVVDGGAVHTVDIGEASYAEAREHLLGLVIKGHRYVEADLDLPQPILSAFSGGTLQVKTRTLVSPTGKRVERSDVDSGLWRIGKLIHLIDTRRKSASYSMDIDLFRAGLGTQRVRRSEDAAPFVALSRRYAGRFHNTKGWAA